MLALKLLVVWGLAVHGCAFWVSSQVQWCLVSPLHTWAPMRTLLAASLAECCPRVKESHWGYFSVYWCNQFQDVKYVPLPLSCCIYLGHFGNIASISSNSYGLRLIRPANGTSRGKGLDQPPWTAVTWCSTSHRIGTSAALCGLRIGGCLSVADQMPFVQHTHWKGLERTGMHIWRECIDFVQSIFMLSFEKWTANIWRGHKTYEYSLNTYDMYDIYVSHPLSMSKRRSFAKERPATQGLADKDHAKASETWDDLGLSKNMLPHWSIGPLANYHFPIFSQWWFRSYTMV